MPNSSGRAMMLAKFSGWPMATQVPSVSRPVSTIGRHGDRHVPHPAQHREQQEGDGDERQHAADREGVGHGAAALLEVERASR